MTNTPVSTAKRAITLIKEEHRTLARMLAAMQAWIARTLEGDGERYFELFDAMLQYVENVPDRLHHPKEDRVLFAVLAARTSAAVPLIRQLEADHVRGEPLIVGLRGAFHAYSYGTLDGLNQLATAVDEFTEFYLDHMRREEQQLLPLALAHLTVDDWQRVARAFGDHADPLFGAELADDFRQLYQCIAELAPPSLQSFLAEAAPGLPAN